MIEKLTTYPRPLPNNPMVVENIGMDNESLFNKINELVDAVNKQEEVIKMLIDGLERFAKSQQEVNMVHCSTCGGTGKTSYIPQKNKRKQKDAK